VLISSIAFPNPTGKDGILNGVGCLKGPFVTGLGPDEDSDHGDGFHVKQIEENPAGFFTDIHSTEATQGAVRGQLGPDQC
jgi:hypothetical protein